MKKILVLLTALCLMLSLCACTDNGQTSTEPQQTTVAETTVATEAQDTAAFEVKVVDADGNAVSGVMIQICKDTCIPKVTDENGVAVFDIEVTDEHKLSVLSCPEGYTYTGEAEVYLEDGATEYTVELDAQ